MKILFEAGTESMPKSAKVYRNVDWDEFIVRFCRASIYQAGADYYTTDRVDAISTACEFATE